MAGLWLVAHERRSGRAAAPARRCSPTGASPPRPAAGALVNLAFYGELFVLSLVPAAGSRPVARSRRAWPSCPSRWRSSRPSPFTSRLIGAVGPRLPLALGGVVATLGSLVLLGMDENSPYLVLAPGSP